MRQTAMCCFCFETVGLDNAQTDPFGIKWDAHWWCAIQDDSSSTAAPPATTSPTPPAT